MSEPEGRLIAIGDVHGCVHALDAVLEGIRPTHADHLVFLGDVIDQGRDTRDVLERLITLRSMCQLTLIQGNHEEMMFAARTSIEALRYWEVCGGLATLTSYRYGAKLTDVPDEHWQFLSENVPYLETEAFIFTHANYLPELPMSGQPEHQLRWALLDPREAQPHCSGKPVVVGHTEQRNGEVLDLGFVTCIDTACCRYGWLTAFDVRSRNIWQASRFGVPREPEEPNHHARLPELTAHVSD